MTADKILTNPTEAQLAASVEENLVDLFRTMAAMLEGGKIVEGEKLSHHHTFPANPMFKGVWHTRLTDEEVDAKIQEVIAWYKACDAPFFFWWDGAQSKPANLGERLLAAGFTRHDYSPNMTADLHQLNEDVQTPNGFEIVTVTDEKGVADWRDTFLASYDLPSWASQAWVDAALHLGVEKAPWRMYVGYLDGKPVATNMLVLGGGVAGLLAVGTVPEARGKGVGAAITLKPLVDAREMGYHYGVLFSSDMGYPLYLRLGFRDTGTKIGRYIWRNG